MNSIFTGFHRFAKQHKVIFGVMLLVLALLAAYSLSNLRLQEDVRTLLPDDKRISKINQVLLNTEFADRIILTFSSADTTPARVENLIKAAEEVVAQLQTDSLYIASINFKQDDEFLMKVYDFIYQNLPFYLSESDNDQIAQRLDPASIEQSMARNLRSLSSLEGLITSDFIFKDPLHLTPLALSRLERFRLDENFIIHRSCVMTKDRQNLLVFIDPVYAAGNTKENKNLIIRLEEVTAKARQLHPETTIAYYGGSAVAVSNAGRIKLDIMLTVSIALLLLLLLFYLIFRNIRYILLIFFPIILGMLFALGILAALEDALSAISLGIGAILIGISLDYSLHAFTHYRSSGSVTATLKSIGTPVMMSCISTASAFLSLSVVQSPALKQLGLFAALAIFFTAMTVLTVIPFFLRGSNNNTHKVHATVFDRLAAWHFHKNRFLRWAILLLSLVFLFTAQRLQFNSDLNTLNYMSPDLKQAEENLRAISAEASSAMYFVVQSNSFEEALRMTEKHESRLRQAQEQGIVKSFSSPVDLMLSPEKQAVKIARWNQFWDTVNRDSLTQTITRKAAQFYFQPFAFDAFFQLLHTDFKPVDFEAFTPLKTAFLTNYFSQSDSLYAAITIIKSDADQKDRLFDMFRTEEEVILFDNQFFMNSFLEVLKDDFSLLVLISMGLVFTILLLFFGRIELALITFFPVVLSWFWTIGIMGLFGIPFNIFNIIISTFILGLGVDYSIFIMSGLIKNHKYGQQSLSPYKLSVLLSAATTLLTLGVLQFAGHPALKSIAVVSMVGIFSVVVVTYTVLPLLFSFMVSNKGQKRKEPVTMLNMSISVITLLIYLFGTLAATMLLPLIILLPAKKTFKKHLVHLMICYSSRFIVYVNITIKKRYVNTDKLDFTKPVIFISNHQSHLDLVLILLMNPKIIALTNNWVWNSPFFGALVRYAGFYPAFMGLGYGVEKIEQKVQEGYSILIFPEGNRSVDGSIRRFHQGAFYLANKLGLDLQPLIIHGAMQSLAKNEFFLKSGHITLTFYDRIKVHPVNTDAGETFRPQAKAMTQFYRKEFGRIQQSIEASDFFRRKLVAQYIYKGPVLEWYIRIKLRLENNYELVNQHLPKKGLITDIGCGYGYLAYLLAFVSAERKITGLDYDREKIRLASHCPARPDHLHFVHADVTNYPMQEQDAFVLSDVLHYLEPGQQARLIRSCIEKLRPGGVLLIRDADKSMAKRHWATRYTEFFSTKSGFNKLESGRLYFSSRETIRALVSTHKLEMQIIENSKLTSNILYIIKKTE